MIRQASFGSLAPRSELRLSPGRPVLQPGSPPIAGLSEVLGGSTPSSLDVLRLLREVFRLENSESPRYFGQTLTFDERSELVLSEGTKAVLDDTGTSIGGISKGGASLRGGASPWVQIPPDPPPPRNDCMCSSDVPEEKEDVQRSNMQVHL